jgi:hypothetical protein
MPLLRSAIRPLIHDPRSKIILPAAVALCIWLLYAVVGQGGEFFVAYRDLVLAPEKLVPVFGFPLTYNPPWLIPILSPFITMPGRAGYVLFLGATIGMVLYATRVFSGRHVVVLLSAQLFWVLWWGQIEGLVILGMALAWQALKTKSWMLMIVALLLAALKPQMVFLPALAIWWWSGKDRWKSLAGLVLITGLSIVIYGPWPVWFIQNVVYISVSSQYGPWNSSIGLWALPLIIPALALKLERLPRLLALTATGMLISPYMPYYSTLLLLCFPLPWWSILFAFLGYLPEVLGTTIAWNGIVLLPAGVLLWVYWPHMKSAANWQFPGRESHGRAGE